MGQARKTKPGVTVITPTIPGREHLLAEAVASLAAQTVQPYEHLVRLDSEFRGPGPLMNEMVAEAATEWVSILPDDDLYDPDHLETLLGEADNGSIVWSWCRMEGRDDPQYRGEFDPRLFLARRDTGIRGVFMFRKSVWQRLEGFADFMEDWDFLHRAIQAGIRIAPVYRETWTYRIHDTNTSHIVQALADGERPDEMYHLARHPELLAAS